MNRRVSIFESGSELVCKSRENLIFVNGNFVFKQFASKEFLKKSILNWNAIKKFKVNTYNEYSKVKDNLVMMDNLSFPNKLCVGYEVMSEDEKFLSENKIEAILNFDEILVTLKSWAENFNGVVSVFCDSYFLVLEKGKKEVECSIFIGDFENIDFVSNLGAFSGENNFEFVKTFLIRVVNNYVSNNINKEAYLAFIEREFDCDVV